MTTTLKREKLVNYMKVANEKKVKAIYALFEDEIEQETIEYSNEFKTELDSRYAYYKSGGKMVSASEADKQFLCSKTKR
ncbi:hypothetical protein BH11BAC6_BH11BAC6_15540 [soil metagenome]